MASEGIRGETMTTIVAWVAVVLAFLLIGSYGKLSTRIDEAEKENKKLWKELEGQSVTILAKLRAVGK